MEALLISIGIVALAEIGDKTQLLTLVLAARYRKPWPIVAGIFVATLINHGVAGALGAWLTSVIGPSAMRWVLGISFLAMAAWMLIPDKLDDDTGDAGADGSRRGLRGPGHDRRPARWRSTGRGCPGAGLRHAGN